MAEKNDKRLFLLDGSALAYRSYFAFIRNPLYSSRGENTSATYGFTRTLLKIFDEENPRYMAVVFDAPGPTFRHESYEEYKATRQKMPDEMAEQMGRIKEVIEAYRIPILEIPGYEADDVIGTLARRAEEQGYVTYMVTADKDFAQLVTPRILMYRISRQGDEAEVLDPKGVEARFGVPPERIVHVLALMGDTSDNIPGVRGIGEKTAVSLIREYGSLEEVLAHADEIKRANIRQALKEHRDEALLSKQLVVIETDVPIDVDLESLKVGEPDRERLLHLFKELEFSSLLERVATPKDSGKKKEYHVVRTARELQELAAALRKAGEFTFDLETTSQDPMRAEIVGLSFSFEEGVAYYVPVHVVSRGKGTPELLLDEESGPQSFGFPSLSVSEVLRPLFEDASLKKCGQNVKYDLLVLARHGIRAVSVDFDTMVASYLLNPSQRQHNLDVLSLEHFNHKKISTKSLIGSGKNQITMREVEVERVAEYACEDADYTLRLQEFFRPRLEKSGLMELFQEVELPLIEVLMDMEMTGVALDLDFLAKMSNELEAELGRLMADIYELAGEEFNLNSTQQLAQILFTKLKLPAQRRTKTGFSTDADVLERLARLHPLPKKLLEYRELSKLKSTYVDALPKLVHPETGRVHTSYNQTVTATGRLSSSEPNLQNIPIRTDIGRQIRRAFVPGKPDHVILDADYSQIELRIMAHLSGDPTLRASFEAGEDVHTRTAALVFNVPPEMVSPDLRRRAKEINFGIMYGMGRYGLASRLEITPEEAEEFIRDYFIKYPGVNDFIIRTISEARQKGYVTTLLNRRRYLPDINSPNRRVREFAERTAINTPIQGTAADLIKVAMIKIHRRLRREGLRAKMIMQVHDELVFEVPKEEIEPLSALVRQEMESAIELSVPIKVDIGVGPNWLEAH
jgi:DNA polymerase-1